MKKLILCLSLVLASPLAARANGYDVPNVSPRDLAMAGSAVAAQVDAGAVYAMPAALARLREGFSLSAGGVLLDLGNTWNATTPALQPRSPVSMELKLATPVAILASYTTRLFDRGFGLGVGVNVPGGGNVFWPEDWPGRSRIISIDRRVFAFYATLGIELLERLRLGGGLVYYRTTEELSQGIEPTTGQAVLSNAGGAPSFDVSLEGEPFASIPVRLGIDYKHQVHQKLTGTVHFDVPPTLQAQLQDQNATHFLPYPNVLNIGASYQLMPKLQLNATFTFSRYVIYSEDRFTGDKPLPGAIVVPRNYTNGQVYRLGAEWLPTERLVVRAGILRDISGMPKREGPNGELISETYSPTLPDSNSWAGSLGLGWRFARNFTLDAAFMYANMDEVTAQGPDVFPGRYETRAFLYGLGISYHWAPGEGFLAMRPL